MGFWKKLVGTPGNNGDPNVRRTQCVSVGMPLTWSAMDQWFNTDPLGLGGRLLSGDSANGRIYIHATLLEAEEIVRKLRGLGYPDAELV